MLAQITYAYKKYRKMEDNEVGALNYNFNLFNHFCLCRRSRKFPAPRFQEGSTANLQMLTVSWRHITELTSVVHSAFNAFNYYIL